MKKTITLLFVLLFAASFRCLASHDYWGDTNGGQDIVVDGITWTTGGRSVLDCYLENALFGIEDGQFAISADNVLNTENVVVNVTRFNPFYHNFTFKRGQYEYQYAFRTFDITYTVQYSSNNSTWYDIATVSETVATGHCSEQFVSHVNNKTHINKFYNDPTGFASKTIDTGRKLSAGTYYVRVVATFGPSNVNQSETCSGNTNLITTAKNYNGTDPYQSIVPDGTGRSYLQAIPTATGTSPTVQITVTYDDGTRPILDVDTNINPTDKNGNYLVYNNLNAPLSVKVANKNITASSKTYLAVLSTIGSETLPTYSAASQEVWQSGLPSYLTDSKTYFEALTKNTALYTFIKEMVADGTITDTWYGSTSPNYSACWRYRHVVLCSELADMSNYSKNAFESMANLETNTEYALDREYHLRDFVSVCRPSQSQISSDGATSGALINVWTKMATNTTFTSDALQMYGVHHIYTYGDEGFFADETAYRVLSAPIKFKVAYPAYFAETTKQVKYVCSGETSIKLSGRQISIDADDDYQPVYEWQIYYQNKWQDIDDIYDEEYSENPDTELSYSIGNNGRDIKLNSEWVERFGTYQDNGKSLQFRQKVVLKAFSNTEILQISGYNRTTEAVFTDGTVGYFENDAHTIDEKTYYYLSVTEPETAVGQSNCEVVITPALVDHNLVWEQYLGVETDVCVIPDGKYESLITMSPCLGEDITKKYIKLRMVSSGASLMSAEVLDLIDLAVYKITSDGVEQRVANGQYDSIQYVIDYEAGDDTTRYVVRAELCSNTIEREIKVAPLSNDVIDITKVKTSSYCTINRVDERTNTIYLICPKGSSAYINMDEIITDAETKLYWKYDGTVESCQDEMDSVFVATDFSEYTRTQCSERIYREIAAGNTVWDNGNIDYYIENTSLSELKLYCQVKEREAYDTYVQAWNDSCSVRYEWYEFDDATSFSTKLTATENENTEVFVVRTQNRNGCYSESFYVSVSYVDPIENNVIAFDSGLTNSVAYVPKGEAQPLVYGSLVTGGYGEPYYGGTLSYVYTWQYNVLNPNAEGYWVDLELSATDDSGNLNQMTEGVRLSAGYSDDTADFSTLENAVYLRRVVYSRSNNSLLTQLKSISNVVSVLMSQELSEDAFTVTDKKCAGDDALVDIWENGFSYSASTRYEVVCSDPELTIYRFNTLSNTDYPDLLNRVRIHPTNDVTLSICRYDTITGERSNVVNVDVDVLEVEPDFAIVINSVTYGRDEEITVQPGTRISLENKTTGEDNLTYTWTLQVQNFNENASGNQTKVENPALYVYNSGINKIALFAQVSGSGSYCYAKVTAEGINVAGSVSDFSLRSMFVDPETEETEHSFKPMAEEEYMSISPTLLSGATNEVVISTNSESYDVYVYDLSGYVVAQEEGLSETSSLILPDLEPGHYVLRAGQNSFKLLRK